MLEVRKMRNQLGDWGGATSGIGRKPRVNETWESSTVSRAGTWGPKLDCWFGHGGVCDLDKAEWVKVTQSCPTLCNPTDYTVYGILQARTLEWVAIPFSRGSSQPRSPALQVDSPPCEPQGSPHIGNYRVVRRTVWYRRSLLIIYFIYESESCSILSDSLQPHGL